MAIAVPPPKNRRIPIILGVHQFAKEGGLSFRGLCRTWRGPAAARLLGIMTSLPRELGRVQVVRSSGDNGRLQYTLLSAAGVSISLVPRVPGEVGAIMQALGRMSLCDAHDEQRGATLFLDAVCRLQRFARAVAVHRWWHQLYFRAYSTTFGFGTCRFRPLARSGRRPDWWWPRKARECQALRALRPGSPRPHYWSAPSDPYWYDRDGEVVDPLADITSYILEHNPRNAVPHVPSVSPLPTSLPVHVSSWAGFPAATRLLPISAQAPPPVAGVAGVAVLCAVAEDVEWAAIEKEISATVLGGALRDEEADDADWRVVAAGVADSVSEVGSGLDFLRKRRRFLLFISSRFLREGA